MSVCMCFSTHSFLKYLLKAASGTQIKTKLPSWRSVACKEQAGRSAERLQVSLIILFLSQIFHPHKMAFPPFSFYNADEMLKGLNRSKLSIQKKLKNTEDREGSRQR